MSLPSSPQRLSRGTSFGRTSASPPPLDHHRHQRGSSSPGYPGTHAFPYAASESVADLTLLADLIDSRSGWCEGQRQSEEQIEEQCQGKPRAIRNALRSYYENLNYVLDGMRQADVVVESQFPAEVMRRFGTVEEVQQVKGKPNKRSRRNPAYPTPSSTPRRSHTQFLHLLSTSAVSSGGRGYSNLSHTDGYSSEEEEGAEGGPSSADAPTDRRRRPRRRPLKKSIQDLESGTRRPSSSVLNLASLWGFTRPNPTAPVNTDEESGFDSDSEPEPEGAGPGQKKAGERSGLIDRGRKREYGTNKGTARTTPSSAIVRERTSDAGKEITSVENPEPGSAEGSLDRALSEQRQQRKVKQDVRKDAIMKAGHHPEASGSTTTAVASEDNEERDRLTALPPGGKRERDRLELRRAVPGWEEQEEGEEKSVQFAININLFINVLLLAGKAVAVLSSSSVSLLASLVDSALDLLSTLIIFCASKLVAFKSSESYFKYPRGKKNFEPLGVVIFSVLMIASFVQVLVESCERLRGVLMGRPTEGGSQALPWIGIVFMLATIVVKAIMWFLYNKSKSAGVRAVAQDSQNDVVFNIFSLTFPFLGAQLGWPALDPIGGIILSLYIISEWLSTLIEMTTKLSGARASPSELARVLYLITRFKSVKSISACEMYYAGEDFIVEADVVLPVEMALKQAHDLGEIVNYCVETLPSVERAYVHLDYNTQGIPAHISARG
ncbi:hypothetical protein BCV69DRAFT_312806 [Microstroma glucosiphilum]|uniref:Cation efflux protein transmembrane domain-containing protein n=1 Tax=Pseudomicrostroma glucosiphilum TaxID=1684307 RepID=A0A316U4M1_9BASI|nr:hypothetical protein BCV69DRAFT_312806 [Pseudomicrostroma glucosiphilum]PWN20196.1 hypothetical protein BCV69DRAFT_312806 [Pseudomicrostroma glucosiphilum]